MKTAQVIAAILSMSADDLSIVQVVTNDRLGSIQADVLKLAESKSEAEQIAIGFSEEIRQLMPVQRGRKPKYDDVVFTYIKNNPGCKGSQILNEGFVPNKVQFFNVTKRLREQGKIRLEGYSTSARWFPV